MAKKIPPAPKKTGPNTALLVIDVQQGLFQKSTPIYNANALLEKINLLVAQAHAAGVLVVYIQHCNDSWLAPATPGWQLHPALCPQPGDLLITKEHPSSLEGTPLEAGLDARQVGRLVITGLVTHGCVKATALDALAKGYQVTLVSDGHSSFSKDAAELIDKWNDSVAQAGARLLASDAIVFN